MDGIAPTGSVVSMFPGVVYAPKVGEVASSALTRCYLRFLNDKQRLGYYCV